MLSILQGKCTSILNAIIFLFELALYEISEVAAELILALACCTYMQVLMVDFFMADQLTSQVIIQ